MPQVYDIFTVKEKEIHGMTGEEFEDLIGDMYKIHGFEVFPTAKTNDYGADLILKTVSGTICVQAKRQTANVGIKAVQEVYGSMAKYGAACGVVITTAGFSAQAIELAKYCGVTLINGTQLWKEILKIQNKQFVYKEEKSLIEQFEQLTSNKEKYEKFIEDLTTYRNQLGDLLLEYQNQNTQNNSKTSSIEKYYQMISEDYKNINKIKLDFIDDKDMLQRAIKNYEDSEHALLELLPKYNKAIDNYNQNNLNNIETINKLENKFNLQQKILYGMIFVMIFLVGVMTCS